MEEPARLGREAAACWIRAGGVALLALALFGRDTHDGIYGDGPSLLELWRQGGWFYIHLLFLPVVRGCHALLSLGFDLRPHEAIQVVSVASAALLAVLVVHLGGRLCRRPAFALAAAGLVLYTGALRFYAGAVEIHALAGGAAAVGAWLVLKPAASRSLGLGAFCLAYLLVAAAHLSCLLLGPALLLLHLEAERRAGRRATLGVALRHGAAALGGVVVVGGILFLLDQYAMGQSVVWQSGFRGYADYIFRHYDQARLKLPGTVALMAEVVAPYGALLVAAVAGFGPAWRRSPLLGAGLAAWVGALFLFTFRVGAREYGAYLVPALPALGLLAALGLEELARAARPWGFAAGVAALAGLQAALGAWAAGHGLDRGEVLVYPHPWIVTGEELGLPGWAFLLPVARLLPWPVWLAGSLASALALGWAGGQGRPGRLLPGFGAVGLFCLCFLALRAGAESFQRCWPRIWGQPWADYCARAAHRVGERDVLVSCALAYATHYQLGYTLNHEWVNLWALDEPDSGAGRAALAEAGRLCRRARAAGGRVVLSADGVALFRLAEKSGGRPRVNARAFLAELGDGINLWPWTEPALRRLAQAAD